MTAPVSDLKPVTTDVAPHLQASLLTTILATTTANLTIAQFRQLEDALNRISGTGDASKTVGAFFS